jgi:hypothetical protein
VKSLFKVKIYFKDGGETTMYSKDFQHERDMFENNVNFFQQQLMHQGHTAFKGLNGYDFLMKLVIDRMSEQQKSVKIAEFYMNRIYVHEPKLSRHVPVRILTHAPQPVPDPVQ